MSHHFIQAFDLPQKLKLINTISYNDLHIERELKKSATVSIIPTPIRFDKIQSCHTTSNGVTIHYYSFVWFGEIVSIKWPYLHIYVCMFGISINSSFFHQIKYDAVPFTQYLNLLNLWNWTALVFSKINRTLIINENVCKTNAQMYVHT